MIYTAYYYSGSLDKGDLIVRDNRFYPGKYFETFPVWMQYVRKHYPNEHIVMFADTASPISIEEGIKYLDEPFEFIKNSKFALSQTVKLHIMKVSAHTNKYFWAMQRNLVYGLIDAYFANEDFFWLDNDAFLNSEILSVAKNYDVLAPQINHHQFTCDSVCTFISKNRLRQTPIGEPYFERYFLNMLENGPTETRMHSLQEGGLYKTFCYGKTLSYTNLNLSHLSCYENFMKFLYKNPLPTLQYTNLVMKLKNFDFSKIPGVQLEFHDMYYEEV